MIMHGYKIGMTPFFAFSRTRGRKGKQYILEGFTVIAEQAKKDLYNSVFLWRHLCTPHVVE